jgi:3-isopropylmalate dehydratase small subunit
VIAASFSETYKRNAFNNGSSCLNVRVCRLSQVEVVGANAKTAVGPEIEVNYARSIDRV